MKFKKPIESDLVLKARRYRDRLKQFYVNGCELAIYDSIIFEAKKRIVELNSKRDEGLLDTIDYMLERAGARGSITEMMIILATVGEILEGDKR